MATTSFPPETGFPESLDPREPPPLDEHALTNARQKAMTEVISFRLIGTPVPQARAHRISQFNGCSTVIEPDQFPHLTGRATLGRHQIGSHKAGSLSGPLCVQVRHTDIRDPIRPHAG